MAEMSDRRFVKTVCPDAQGQRLSNGYYVILAGSGDKERELGSAILCMKLAWKDAADRLRESQKERP